MSPLGHAFTLFAACTALGWALQAAAGEAPQPLTGEQVDKLLSAAPDLAPRLAGLGLKLRLVDYIHCADVKDPHGFMDQGTSRIVDSGVGEKVRETAAHRHAFFSYRFRAAGKDQPHLIVFEYPDDEKRTITFATHESGLSGRSNIDWSLETGVYTGDPLPLTKKMQLHTFVMWPQDAWPAVLVGNWIRQGKPAACSRIWVYAVEGGLPPLALAEPDPAHPRLLGGYYSFALLPMNLLFGLNSPKSVEHMLEYYKFIGQNVVSWSTVNNNAWGFACKIPAWDGGDKSEELDRVLEAFDRAGGMHFIASFALPDEFKIGGKALKAMEREELKAVLLKGFDQFLERYGKFRALRGISLGGQYGIHFLDLLIAKGVAQDVVAHLKAKRPDLLVETYLGGHNLHDQYFHDAGAVVGRWEKGTVPWPEHLAQEALNLWREWKHEPAELVKIQGLTVSEQYQPDDHRIFDTYSFQPRAFFYSDLDRAAARSNLIQSRHANLWDTHFEGWWGLWPGYNFWYKKLWVAPAYNPPPPYSLCHWSRMLEHRDREAIVAGAWNCKHFGFEMHMRRFAQAFRALPVEELQDAPGTEAVQVRWLAKEGKRYVTLLNVTPFEARVSVDGKLEVLPPFELKTLIADGKAQAPAVALGGSDAEYRDWIGERLQEYRRALEAVEKLDPAAAPPAFRKHLEKTEKRFRDEKLHAADVALGCGLLEELRVRASILVPPVLPAPRVAAAPPLNGKLEAWPKEASTLRADSGEFLASHLYMPNSWTGPDDLSLTLRLAHDGTKLYVGAEVRDQVVEPLDGLTFVLSTNGAYKKWLEKEAPYDLRWSIDVPEQGQASGKGPKGFEYVCRRTQTGYVVEGSAPLAELGLAPGGKLGFAAWLSDGDKTENLKKAGWARKTILLLPNRPLFEYWGDARSCGELELGK